MKKKSTKTLSYSVYYEAADEGGFVAIVPALPGCHTQGETLEEAEQNIREAIELYSTAWRRRHLSPRSCEMIFSRFVV